MLNRRDEISLRIFMDMMKFGVSPDQKSNAKYSVKYADMLMNALNPNYDKMTVEDYEKIYKQP